MNSVSDILENYNGCKCSGGGGGEIKTAHVTIICPKSQGAYLNGRYGVIIMDEGILAADFSGAITGGDEFDIVLNENDEFHGYIQDTAAVTVVSGGITLGEVEEYDSTTYNTTITITGDCTITATGSDLT